MVYKLLFLIVYIIYGICICIVLGSSNQTISITWTIDEKSITLVCEVQNLFLQVDFLHNLKPFGAYCIPPQPRPSCTGIKDGNITQDLDTNYTILVLNSHVKKNYGVWSCIHGSNRDKSRIVIINKQAISSSHGSHAFTNSQDVGISMLSIILCVLLTLVFLMSCTCAVKHRCKLKKQGKEGPRENMLDVSIKQNEKRQGGTRTKLY